MRNNKIRSSKHHTGNFGNVDQSIRAAEPAENPSHSQTVVFVATCSDIHDSLSTFCLSRRPFHPHPPSQSFFLLSVMQPDITEDNSSPSSSQLSSTIKRPALSSGSRSLSTSKTNLNVTAEERPYELESLYREPPPLRSGHTPPWLVRASESFGRSNPRLYGWARKGWLYMRGPRPKVDMHRMLPTRYVHM
jgi:hypothetical protein